MEKRFTNIYQDGEGKFISNEFHDSFESAYNSRDDFKTYQETVQVLSKKESERIEELEGVLREIKNTLEYMNIENDDDVIHHWNKVHKIIIENITSALKGGK